MKNLFILYTLIWFISCETQKSDENIEAAVVVADTFGLVPESNIDSFIEVSNKQIEEDNLKPENQKIVHILSSEVKFNSNFRPYLEVSLKNNSKFDIIAFTIVIDPTMYKGSQFENNPNPNNNECSPIYIKSNTIVKSGKTYSFKKAVTHKSENCELEYSKISIGETVFSNGQKFDLNSLLGEISAIEELK